MEGKYEEQRETALKLGVLASRSQVLEDNIDTINNQ